ncbi:hypothetical protein L208DRAFT_1276521, partial [Tricholoma matsutake]
LCAGATGLFIDAPLTQQHCLNTHSLSCPIPVYNVDGSPNEAGAIRRPTCDRVTLEGSCGQLETQYHSFGTYRVLVEDERINSLSFFPCE